MGRRFGLPLHGRRYCGNTNTMEVHDLDNEVMSPSGCQIDNLIAVGYALAFFPDDLSEAHKEGFTDCAHCLGAPRKKTLSGVT